MVEEAGNNRFAISKQAYGKCNRPEHVVVGRTEQAKLLYQAGKMR